MNYFKVGQTVYCALFGEGVVVEIGKEETVTYPITVSFKDNVIRSYTLNGKFTLDLPITLSQKPIQQIVPITNVPLPEFNLTFAQAMEAVYAGKKVMFESWANDGNIKFSKHDSKPTDVIYLFSNDKLLVEYGIQKRELTGKWRIVE